MKLSGQEHLGGGLTDPKQQRMIAYYDPLSNSTYPDFFNQKATHNNSKMKAVYKCISAKDIDVGEDNTISFCSVPLFSLVHLSSGAIGGRIIILQFVAANALTIYGIAARFQRRDCVDNLLTLVGVSGWLCMCMTCSRGPVRIYRLFR